VSTQKHPVPASFALFVATLALLAGIVSAQPSRRDSASVSAPAAGPSGYHLLKKIALGGEGGWDYLTFDSPTRRLFISRQSKVIVLDVDS